MLVGWLVSSGLAAVVFHAGEIKSPIALAAGPVELIRAESIPQEGACPTDFEKNDILFSWTRLVTD
jgi:hypothetical protein